MFRATRSAVTVARAARGFSTATNQASNEFLTERAAAKAHAAETTALWKKVSFFVCIPAALLGAAWTYKLESEHHHHLEHLKEENGGQLPEIPKYEYLNIRNKPFPWGMQALFFNPEVNTRVE